MLLVQEHEQGCWAQTNRYIGFLLRTGTRGWFYLTILDIKFKLQILKVLLLLFFFFYLPTRLLLVVQSKQIVVTTNWKQRQHTFLHLHLEIIKKKLLFIGIGNETDKNIYCLQGVN